MDGAAMITQHEHEINNCARGARDWGSGEYDLRMASAVRIHCVRACFIDMKVRRRINLVWCSGHGRGYPVRRRRNNEILLSQMTVAVEMCPGNTLAQSDSARIEQLTRDNESVVPLERSVGAAVVVIIPCVGTDRQSDREHPRREESEKL